MPKARSVRWSGSREGQPVVGQAHLYRVTDMLGRNRFADQIVPGDAEQFGLELADEDPRLGIAARPGDGPASERAVDMDMAIGDDFGPRADRAEHDQITAAGIDLRARADRLG